MPVVEYDTLLNFHTLAWFNPDIEINFDRANHIDCDVHISLLYDVGEEDPTKFTAIRVGLPAGREDRIGFLTPPASPRKFKEETISGREYIDSRRYQGNMSVIPTGSDIGIVQTVRLENPTCIAEVEMADSPLVDESDAIFDSSVFIDLIQPISITLNQLSNETDRYLFDHSDRLEYFHSTTDNITFDFNTGNIEGTVKFNYDIDRIHIANAYVQFNGGWSPKYKISGIGSLQGARSPISLYVKHTGISRRGLDRLRNTAGLRLFLFINDRRFSTNLNDYRWIYLDYGFSKSNWRYENISRPDIISPMLFNSLSGMPKFEPLKAIRIKNIPSAESVYTITLSYITDISASRTLSLGFGNIRAGIFSDNIRSVYLHSVTNILIGKSTVMNVLENTKGINTMTPVDNVKFMTNGFITGVSPSKIIIRSW